MVDQGLIESLVTELKRGVLTLSVLGSLKTPYYGYELLQVLQSKSVEIEANTLYPLLRRLDSQGLLLSTWDTTESRPRKYYSISEDGENVYNMLLGEWVKMNQSVEQIIKGGN